nr:uncharacterized protein LOC117849661 isoform X1 [Setaria viridis]
MGSRMIGARDRERPCPQPNFGESRADSAARHRAAANETAGRGSERPARRKGRSADAAAAAQPGGGRDRFGSLVRSSPPPIPLLGGDAKERNSRRGREAGVSQRATTDDDQRHAAVVVGVCRPGRRGRSVGLRRPLVRPTREDGAVHPEPDGARGQRGGAPHLRLLRLQHGRGRRHLAGGRGIRVPPAAPAATLRGRGRGGARRRRRGRGARRAQGRRARRARRLAAAHRPRPRHLRLRQGEARGLSYFAGAEKKDDRVLVPDLGSLTSIHDRACELFYYLKGGQVDYGEDHSKACGHTRFGRIYHTGHYPVWDDQNPVHFVGHSAGAQVVRVLHQMLADKAFPGHDTSEDWILSLTSLSGALNGTTRTYYDGMLVEDGKFMRSICLLQLCRLGVIVYDWLDIPWLKNYYNFGFDHYEMSRRKVGFSGLIDLLLGRTGPFASGDWILPDLTIQGSIKLNSSLRTFPNTFYFSYATKKTRKLFGITVPSSVLGVHPMLFLRVLQMCMWRHPQNAPLPYKGYR